MAKSTIDRDDLPDIVKASTIHKKYRRIVETIQREFDIESVEKEMRNHHFTRKSRVMTDKVDARTLIDASANDMRARGRLVELQMNALRFKLNLERTLQECRRYAISEWGEASGIRTKENQRNYFDRFFRRGNDLLVELNFLHTMADAFIADIDKAGYGLSTIRDSLDNLYTKERQV